MENVSNLLIKTWLSECLGTGTPSKSGASQSVSPSPLVLPVDRCSHLGSAQGMRVLTNQVAQTTWLQGAGTASLSHCTKLVSRV